MQWIRENLFLACLAGVVVVCFGVAFTVRSGQDTAFETDDMDPRSDLAYEIGRLRDSKPVNKQWLDKAKKRLDRIRRQRNKVLKEAVGRLRNLVDDSVCPRNRVDPEDAKTIERTLEKLGYL